jgi:zinc resistance-associated protein
MLKPVIAATAILAIAGSSVVYAQQRFGGDGAGHWGPRGEHRHHHRPSADDMAAFTDARIAALKAGLELTPDQQKNWPAFEQALRDMAQLRMQRIEARQAHQQGGATQQSATPQQGATPQTQAQGGPFDRLEKRADAMAKRSAALKKLADAGAPLYASLTDAQKERFHTLARVLRPHQRMRMAFNERNGGWRQGGQGGEGGHGMGQGGPGFGPGHHRFGHDGRGGDGGGGSQL